MKQDMLYSLQIGRALAALAVVLHHSALSINSLGGMPEGYFKLFRLGDLGIDYFFVLSGFIIAHATAKLQMNAHGAKHYAFSRIVRIFVPYLPISIAMMSLRAASTSLSITIPNDFSWLGSLFLLPSEVKPALWVAWTLQHEMVFYFLFAICFFVFKRPLLILLWSIPILALQFFTQTNLTNTLAGIINLEFLLGVIAYYLFHQGKLYRMRYLLMVAGVGLIAAGCTQIYNDSAFPYYHSIVGIGFACIVLGLVYIERHMDFGRFRILTFLGTASYAIYLIHGPSNSILLRLLASWPHWYMLLVAFTVLSTLAGVAYFLLIEKPLTRMTKKWIGSFFFNPEQRI